jgi:putative DNA primase/helicase
LSGVAEWKASKRERNGGFRIDNAHPPAWSVSAILAREDWPNIRYLAGVVEVPTLRSDGSVIDKPGYDPATGLLYLPNGEFPSIPSKVTKDDALEAAKKLLELVKDFPFKEGHKYAWLAALLTVLGRFLIDGPVPVFMFEANTSGAGKTLLADLIALILTGRHMTRTGYYHDPVEMDKQIVATCLAGDLVVLFDNVDNGGEFGNSALDRATTGRTYRGRILGKSEMTPDLDLNTVFFCSGNNINLCGDIVRRIVPCRLESPLERPEERNDFTIKDLAAHTLKHRVELVCAGLTIVKGFLQAERTDQKLAPMDFPAWSNLIRSSVKWATGEDPAIGREDLTESDPEREHCAAFVEGWFGVQTAEKDRKGMTSAQMLKEVKDFPDKYQIIRDAMGNLWPKIKTGELPSSGSIGMKIQAIRGKVFGDKRFQLVGEEKKVKRWSVVVVPKSGGSSGSSGAIQPDAREETHDKCKRDKCKSVNENGRDGKQAPQTHQTHHETPDPETWEEIKHAFGG